MKWPLPEYYLAIVFHSVLCYHSAYVSSNTGRQLSGKGEHQQAFLQPMDEHTLVVS